ncbi:hypothetical protein NQ318_002578, partial [Aromia moschata]
MARLSEIERIEILMIIGYGDRRRSFDQVVVIFNELHPDREPLSKSTVSKTLQRFHETGGVKDRPKSGRPVSVTNEENSLNVMYYKLFIGAGRSSIRALGQALPASHLQEINGCGDKTRTQKQVCEIFKTKYPDCRILPVYDIPKSGRKPILDDEQKWDTLLDIQDNPHKPTRQNNMCYFFETYSENVFLGVLVSKHEAQICSVVRRLEEFADNDQGCFQIATVASDKKISYDVGERGDIKYWR